MTFFRSCVFYLEMISTLGGPVLGHLMPRIGCCMRRSLVGEHGYGRTTPRVGWQNMQPLLRLRSGGGGECGQQPHALISDIHEAVLNQNVAIGDMAEGLETPVQLIYLSTLLGFLVVGAYLVVRQVLIRRELEEAAKVLGDRVRNQEASAEDYFELGVILLRKKLFTQATTNLEKALKSWEGEPEELAQVHNALGYSYFNLEKTDAAIREYRKAVELQPGYVTAWNNLGDVLERQRKYQEAYDAYQEVLAFAPDNKVARTRSDFCKTRIDRSQGIGSR